MAEPKRFHKKNHIIISRICELSHEQKRREKSSTRWESNPRPRLSDTSQVVRVNLKAKDQAGQQWSSMAKDQAGQQWSSMSKDQARPNIKQGQQWSSHPKLRQK